MCKVVWVREAESGAEAFSGGRAGGRELELEGGHTLGLPDVRGLMSKDTKLENQEIAALSA